MTKLRSAIKHVVLWGFVYLWAPCRNAVRRLLGRGGVIVLMYHRVSDQYKDNVTLGKDQFRRQMEIVRRRCDVLDISDLLAQHGRPRRRTGVVITFDDGYEDNYEASRILRELSTPCTFFLSTRIVGSDGAFQHDLDRLGRRVPALQWDQAREMAQAGFNFGNHTMSHANLGRLSVDEAVAEVSGAKEDLRRELGEAGRGAWLAYPFGREEDMRPDVLDALSKAGVECCFSGYGGTNPPDFNPMNILRQGVSHNFNDLSFMALLEGWRVRKRRRSRA